MKRFEKLLVAAVFLISSVTPVFAADGVITYVKGKVEVQRNSAWVALNVGDKITQSEMISTGFQSEAKIKLMDSVLYLGPVTRVTLETLKSSDSTDKVNVYLATGATRSKVEHTDSKRVNYTVRTAVAVASVRGTDWIMDSAGNVSCLEGGVAVALISSLDNSRPADSKGEADSEDVVEEDTDSFEDSPELPTGGLLITANQTVTITENTPVAPAQNNVTKSVVEILNAVSSASSKEAVSSSNTNKVESSTSGDSIGASVSKSDPVVPDPNPGNNPNNPNNPSPDNPTPANPSTGTVTVDVSVE